MSAVILDTGIGGGRPPSAEWLRFREAVRHVVEDRPHALLAFLQRNLGSLALDELADLRTYVVHHRDQAIVQRARGPGVERDHAHHAPAAAHGKADDAVQPVA